MANKIQTSEVLVIKMEDSDGRVYCTLWQNKMDYQNAIIYFVQYLYYKQNICRLWKHEWRNRISLQRGSDKNKGEGIECAQLYKENWIYWKMIVAEKQRLGTQ